MKRLFQFSRRSAHQIRDDVDAELRFHLDTRVAALVATGVSRDDATEQARREFGDLAEARHHLYRLDRQNEAQRRWSDRMQNLRQDIHYSLRTLRAAPVFTMTSILTLALGIGATVVIFSAVWGLLLRPLPFRNADRIVQLQVGARVTASEPEFEDLRRDLARSGDVAAYTTRDANVKSGEDPEHVALTRVSDGFFNVLGTAPLLGRTFTPEEDRLGAPAVTVLSYALWQRSFGGDRAILGKSVEINNEAFMVVGVMPRQFDYPAPDVALWTPLRLNPDSLWARNNHYLRLVQRMNSSTTADAVASRVHMMASAWRRDYPDVYRDVPTIAVVPLRAAFVRDTRSYLVILFGAVGFVLLIACANVANLILTRGEARRREFAVRAALGASSGRLLTQLLTENLVLALSGGALGVIAAMIGGRLLLVLAPGSIPRIADIAMDRAVLMFALVLSIGTGLLFGLVPAWRASRENSVDTLRRGGRSTAHAVTGKARRLLLAVEVALAVALLGSAGLLVRSMWYLQSVDLGFDSAHLLTMTVSIPRGGYTDPITVRFINDVVDRVSTVPGVRASSAAAWAPISGSLGNWSVMIDGRVDPDVSTAPTVEAEPITLGYFETMRIPLMRGRGFSAGDRADAPLVGVASQAMARAIWPGVDPIGHTIRMSASTGAWVTIVGVARDVRANGIQADPPSMLYLPYAQATSSAYFTPKVMSLMVRTTGNPDAVVAPVRAIIRNLDRNVPVYDVVTMDRAIGASIANRHFTTILLLSFALLALALACIGIYGVVAYGVSQRTGEIGLRMALGADRQHVLSLVIGDAMLTSGIGLICGLAGAVAIATLLRSLLVGVGPVDLPTMGAVSVLLLGVVLIASGIPARRASAVSPTEALRGG